MKKVLVVFLFLIFGCGLSYADYYLNDDQTYDINSGSQIGNTYYLWNDDSHSYTGYTQQNNQIYGSDGSSYTRFGNTVQDNSNGKTYQVNNNLVEELY